MHQTPDHFGIARARWRLVDLQPCPALPELADYSLPGICKLLQRLGIRSKRGRLKVHSPDPAYPAKVFALQQAQALARRFPQRVRLLYADEVGCYRQPTLADRYAGHPHEPVAPLSQRANTRWRIGGALDVASGQVTYVHDLRPGRCCRGGGAMRTARAGAGALPRPDPGAGLG